MGFQNSKLRFKICRGIQYLQWVKYKKLLKYFFNTENLYQILVYQAQNK